jgi:hypothetical protein
VADIGKWDGNGKWLRDKALTLPTSATGAWEIYSPMLADLDGDGVLEALAGSGYVSSAEGDHPDGRVYAWKYDPATQTFKRYCPSNPSNPDTCFFFDTKYWWTYAAAAMDADADGILDLVFPPHNVRFDAQGAVKGAGTGGFPLDLNHDGVWEWTGDYGWLFADVDADGKDERLSGVHVQELDGTELPGWPVAAHGANVNASMIADINGDGRTEVLFADNQYVSCWQLGEGSWDRKRVTWWGNINYFNPIQWNGQYDAFEPNGAPAKAPILAGPRGTVTAFVWKSGDVDYYRLPIFGYWTGYSLRVSSIAAGKDYDMVVTGADGQNEQCRSAGSGSGDESCYVGAYVPNVDFKGYFLVKISGKGTGDWHNVKPYLFTWEKNNY